jgi:hypothetical protein
MIYTAKLITWERSDRLIRRWTFDLPKADKCLLASGELGVHLLFQFHILFFN